MDETKGLGVVDYWPWSEGENTCVPCVFVIVSAVLTFCDRTCPLDESNQKFFIRDMFGRLAMLHVDTTGVPTLVLRRGKSYDLVTMISGQAPANYLTRIRPSVLYHTLAQGDSQLLRIIPLVVSNLDSLTQEMMHLQKFLTVHGTCLAWAKGTW